MWGEQKKQIYYYTMHTQIFTMFANISIFAIFFQKYFNSKYNLTTFFNKELSNNSIWTSTDIPNACRDTIVLYVSDTWISNTWIFNILFCTWRPGPALQDCVILIVIEVDMYSVIIKMSWIWMFYWYWSHMIICKGEHRSFLHAWASTWICQASKKSSPISPGLVRCERKFQPMIILIKVIQNVCVIPCQRHFVLRNQHNHFFFY